MKRWILAAAFFFLCLSPLSARIDLDLFGYFESQISGAKIRGNFYQLYTNKLRVDVKSILSDNITFTANFDYITYHGKTEWDILEFLSPSITQDVPTGLGSLYVLKFSDRNFLDNAYIKFSFEYFDLTVGKQQISLGTGYVWNPIDIFNIKDLLDPTYEQPGHNAIRLDVPIGTAYTLTALYSPDETWEESAKLIQFKGRVSHFDYAFTAIEKGWTFHDYTRFNLLQGNFLKLPEKRQLLGVSTAGELLGLGVWAEYAYNKMELSKDFYELVVGADYTFDVQTYVMIEYYRNTLGKTDYEEYTINDWMRLFAQEQKSVTRDQIYGLVQHPVTDFLNLGLSSVYSLSDNSIALIPTLNYSLSDNVEVFAYLNFNFGKEGKVFARIMGDGGLVRVRVYF